MNTTNPSSNLDSDAINDRVTTALHSHRIKIRVLTSVAFLFGFLTVAASVLFVCAYCVFVLPKQKQMLRDAEVAVQHPREARFNPGAGEESVQDAIKRIDQFMGVEVLMIHVISMGMTAIAVALGILGLGTLVLLTVVVLNRRIALRQINASLAQISNQLREMKMNRSSGPSTA